MSVQEWTYLIVGITFTLYIGIAIWSRAGSTKDFYVAGGGVSPLANGMATAADWMSAASFISMAGIISFTGYDGSVYLMGWTGGYVLLALLLAPYLRKFGKFTVHPVKDLELPELQKSHANKTNWTLCVDGDGNRVIVNGFMYVNRECFLITKKAWDANPYDIEITEPWPIADPQGGYY